MVIMGVDPGSIVTGFGVIHYLPGQRVPVYISSGTIRLSGMLASRLKVLHEDLTAICEKYQPRVMVVEGLFSKVNWSSALVLGHARGVILLVAEQYCCDIIELQPRTVKKIITGSGAASKKLVSFMVGQRLGIVQPLRCDASDALALAMSYTVRVTP